MRTILAISCAAACLALAGCEAGGSGGTSQAGGATATGGQHQSSGGATGTGGSSTSGGTTGSGGTKGTGGATASGGATSTGGSSATGGSAGSGGITASGGRDATGGASASGGATTSTVTTASGGATGSGGLTSPADASSAGGGRGDGGGRVSIDAEPACTPTDNCTEANKTVTSGTGKHCCYTYENWVGSGNSTLTLKPDGFSVNWTGSTQFVGRKGIRPGSGNLVTQYNASFSPNGNGYLCLYGWTTDPLVEYYVLESWGSYKPPGGSSLGTVTSDGGTYDIYKAPRTNEPSIIGTATFPQYWSVRQQKRTSGTITLANHIAAWASKGMPMGTFYEVSMTVEGYQSSGTADVKFSMK